MEERQGDLFDSKALQLLEEEQKKDGTVFSTGRFLFLQIIAKIPLIGLIVGFAIRKNKHKNMANFGKSMIYANVISTVCLVVIVGVFIHFDPYLRNPKEYWSTMSIKQVYENQMEALKKAGSKKTIAELVKDEEKKKIEEKKKLEEKKKIEEKKKATQEAEKHASIENGNLTILFKEKKESLPLNKDKMTALGWTMVTAAENPANTAEMVETYHDSYGSNANVYYAKDKIQEGSIRVETSFVSADTKIAGINMQSKVENVDAAIVTKQKDMSAFDSGSGNGNIAYVFDSHRITVTFGGGYAKVVTLQ